jgi:hypothetical protein
MPRFCTALWLRDIHTYIVFSLFIPLLPLFKDSVFLFIVYMLFAISIALQFIYPIQYQSHLVFLHIYWHILKQSCSGDKVSHCFSPFWLGKLSDKCLPIRTLLYVSFKYVLIGLANIMGTTYSMRILHNTYLLAESQVFLTSMDSCPTVSVYSHIFASAQCFLQPLRYKPEGRRFEIR